MGGATGSDDEAVAWFRSFLRIRTVSGEGPSGSYLEAQNWLTTFIGENLKVDRVCVVSPKPNKPIVLATILGSEPSLPGVLLNSHYDVVPVMPEFWDVDPFDGHRTSDGKIIGRGAQDMKCVCVQYLVSLLRLRKQGWQPCRSLHLSFVPDEEVGGMEGMGLLLETPEWKSMLPIGLALDEGLASPSDAYTVFYGERLPVS
jgi:aminoacylase